MKDTVVTFHPRRAPQPPAANTGTALYKGLPDDVGVLWVELRRNVILVRSEVVPDHALINGVLGCSTQPTDLDWRVGDLVRWALVASPTRSIARPVRVNGKKLRGKIVALTKDDDVREWAVQRLACLAPAGITVTDMRPDFGKNGSITARRYLTGAGVVRDVEALVEAMTAGVGRGKAMGCGLLRVSPAEPEHA